MLDELSIKIIQFLTKYESVSTDQLCDNFGQDIFKTHIGFLVENQYIKGTPASHLSQNYFTKEIKEIPFTVGPYEITPKGTAYLKAIENQQEQYMRESVEKQKINFRENINTLLAAMALIIAIIALFCD